MEYVLNDFTSNNEGVELQKKDFQKNHSGEIFLLSILLENDTLIERNVLKYFLEENPKMTLSECNNYQFAMVLQTYEKIEWDLKLIDLYLKRFKDLLKKDLNIKYVSIILNSLNKINKNRDKASKDPLQENLLFYLTEEIIISYEKYFIEKYNEKNYKITENNLLNCINIGDIFTQKSSKTNKNHLEHETKNFEEKKNFLTVSILNDIGKSLSTLKGGSLSLWNALEDYNYQFIENHEYVPIKISSLKILVRGFSSQKHGGKQFWQEINQILIGMLTNKRIMKHEYYDLVEIMESLCTMRRGSNDLWLEFEACLRFFSRHVFTD